MSRIDRIDYIIGLAYGPPLSAEEAHARGVTIDDAEAASWLLRLDLEVQQASDRPTVRGVVEEYLRDLGLNDR